MANDNTKEMDTANGGIKKELTFDEKVIKKIVGSVAAEVPGILALKGGLFSDLADRFGGDDITKGINVEIGKKQVGITVVVICEYGKSQPVIFDNLVEALSKAVHSMTGLEIAEVNMRVSDVMTKEDFDKQSKKSTDEKPAEKAD